MKSKTLTALAITSTVAFAAMAFAADTNSPFSAKSLKSGYQVAQQAAPVKKADGKCGEGKCGAEKK